jgi:hypothetical protein
VIAQFRDAAAENARRQMDVLLAGNLPPREDLRIDDLNDVDRTINGQPARFTISRGIGENTRTQYWRVTGQFRGRGGAAALVLQVPAVGSPEERIREFVESIR